MAGGLVPLLEKEEKGELYLCVHQRKHGEDVTRRRPLTGNLTALAQSAWICSL